MMDHHVLFYMFATPMPYRVSFYGSFAGLLVAMARFVKFGIVHTGDLAILEEGQVLDLMRRVNDSERGRLWWIELAIMCFENSLFYSFLFGMTEGLRNCNVAGWDQRQHENYQTDSEAAVNK